MHHNRKTMVTEQEQQQQQQQVQGAPREFETRNKPLWKRWRLVIPLLLLFAAIVVLVVDLALKPEPGVVDHNWMFLEEIHRSNPTNLNSSSVNMTLRTVLLLSNPNLSARFRYFNAGVYVLLPSDDDRLVGQAAIAPGAVDRQSSRNLSAVVRVLFNREAPEDVMELLARTNISGYVSKWSLFKRHYRLVSDCRVRVGNGSLSYSCGGDDF